MIGSYLCLDLVEDEVEKGGLDKQNRMVEEASVFTRTWGSQLPMQVAKAMFYNVVT